MAQSVLVGATRRSSIGAILKPRRPMRRSMHVDVPGPDPAGTSACRSAPARETSFRQSTSTLSSTTVFLAIRASARAILSRLAQLRPQHLDRNRRVEWRTGRRRSILRLRTHVLPRTQRLVGFSLACWCWFIMREKYYWLVDLDWLKPTNEQAKSSRLAWVCRVTIPLESF